MGSRWQASSTISNAAQALWFLMLLAAVPWTTVANLEGDALHALRQALLDPAGNLESWDPSLIVPCTWLHVTCNPDNFVVRLDLGHASLSGNLVAQLGELSQLQYLDISSNNISGAIPTSLGKLSQLVFLDLNKNSLNGSIPESLGQLSQLEELRLNNNTLSGTIPAQLTSLNNLLFLDLSYNNLFGNVPITGVFAKFNYASFQGNPYLQYPLAPTPTPSSVPTCPNADSIFWSIMFVIVHLLSCLL